MPKSALSVTLDDENLVWLRGRVAATGRRSVSDLLDALVTQARTAGRGPMSGVRSVVGTIDIAADDPNLEFADQHITALFDRSIRRPVMVKERPAEHGVRPKPTRKRRG